QATPQQLSTISDLSTVFRNIGKAMSPSVVNIQVRKTISMKGENGQAMPFPPDMLKRFFQNPDQGKGDDGGGGGDGQNNADEGPQVPDNNGSYEQVGTGSGVIMDVDGKTGYILTNNHVAGGASSIVVTLADGRVIDHATLVGADPKSDLAVVKIEASNLAPAKWGDSSTLSKGDWILAFGSPFGYIGSMTHGIVSALDRTSVGILGQNGYEDFIQVDAPINPGNSGGPLVNIQGEVVGINTAIASRSGGFQGIGFAIPSNEAKFVYNSLKDTGKVTRGWLGVGIADVSQNTEEVKHLGYTGNGGVLVEQTFPNTPAFGKLQAGDVITGMDSKPVIDTVQLRNAIAVTSPNTDVTLQVVRDGKTMDETIRLGVQPVDLTAIAENRAPGNNPGGNEAQQSAEAFGMHLVTPDDDMVQKFQLASKDGALVDRVQHGSPAEQAGIQPGDLITRVGHHAVNDAAEAGKQFARPANKAGVLVYVQTADGSRFVYLQPSDH
ncbi:MAG TPA: trypsin-like peptidase domain-containing protein, partial [Tepidisphaeraceae bacterium]|nr:trypsin-like peptidase domain-containing protein [Tepidisphaeraceae bacterium]